MSDAPGNAAEVRRPVGRPCRPVPADFVEKWPQFGWETAGEEWRCNNRTIQRWIDECGRSMMILARKRYREAQRAVASRARRKNYVMGRTMTPVVGQKGGTGDQALANSLSNHGNSDTDGGQVLHREEVED